jgi:hypothetical protein
MESNDSTKATPKGFKFTVLLGTVFTVVGLGMGVWLANDLVTAHKMQSWEETPATIIQAKLEVTPDMEGNQPTYKATAEYKYRYGSTEYTGNRVSIHRGSDNLGSFQKDVHRQLSGYQSSGRPFRCYVNPANPAESILFRDVRWESIGLWAVVTVVFGGAGIGMLVFSRIRKRNEQSPIDRPI